MKLYAIAQNCSQIKRLIEVGVPIIQYRNKGANHDIKALCEISELCLAKDICFIINDDLSLAKSVKASGVHVGKDDESVLRAREMLGNNAIIGASSYASVERALELESLTASYIAFGAVFASPTKRAAPKCDLEVIQKARKLLKTPLCAIGGINANNASLLKGLGLDYAAIISALFVNDEIEKNAKELMALLKE